MLSAAISAQSTREGLPHALRGRGPREITSISPFSPYWVQTEHTTARNTETRTTICAGPVAPDIVQQESQRAGFGSG